MHTLYMIIHEDFLKNLNYGGRFNTIFDRIDYVRRTYAPHVASINMYGTGLSIAELCDEALRLSEMYGNVILLGGSRLECLADVGNALEAAGKSWAYDEDGSI